MWNLEDNYNVSRYDERQLISRAETKRKTVGKGYRQLQDGRQGESISKFISFFHTCFISGVYSMFTNTV